VSERKPILQLRSFVEEQEILAHIDGDIWEKSLEREQEELDKLTSCKARILEIFDE
jgi:hypothetical protein